MVSLNKRQKYNRVYYRKNKESISKNTQRWYYLRKIQCLIHYAGAPPSCLCCGEKNVEFLTIDHIGGGGAKHVKSISLRLYYWLVKNNFPPGFQVLCWNCNESMGHYNYCPHKGRTESSPFSDFLDERGLDVPRVMKSTDGGRIRQDIRLYCRNCGHVWYPVKENPKFCPKCKWFWR